MRFRDWIMPTLASCAAALAFLPARGVGYSVTGDYLNLHQRDFRVFNNFSDNEANDNHVEHPEFPGAKGAVLSIWKGVAEWGSEPHGLGEGDPTQVLGIGSGGANFDSSFQGLARSIGSKNANVISELHAYGGGTYAYCELPTSNGWRIRYFKDPTVWDDNPSAPSDLIDGFDIQGVAAHEYGHALGLGHTPIDGATMYSGSPNRGVNLRSLETDDIDGIQSLYGARVPTKPHIQTYRHIDFATGQSEILGAGFVPFGNEVWFTRALPTFDVEDGTPVRVLDLASHDGGTRIVVNVPAEAGPGDILVKTPGVSTQALSNAYPFDPDSDPCIVPISYGNAKLTSQGTLPELYWAGLPSLRLGGFTIGTYGGVGQERGFLISGTKSADIPYQGGTVLVARPFVREAQFSFFFGATEVGVPIEPWMVGTTRYYQMWFEDPGDAFGSGLSNALEVLVCN